MTFSAVLHAGHVIQGFDYVAVPKIGQQAVCAQDSAGVGHAASLDGAEPAAASTVQNLRTVSIPGFAVAPHLMFQIVVNGTFDSRANS
jgi:hypothetical protein